MGKKDKKTLDITCPYCSKRYNREELLEEGYIDVLPMGESVWCPNSKCDSQFLIEK